MNDSLPRICPHCGLKYSVTVAHSSHRLRESASRLLAQHLVFSLQVKEGRELVLILGTTGRENNNLEAITSWVSLKVSHVQCWPMPSSEAADLIEKLETDLKSVLQDISLGWLL